MTINQKNVQIFGEALIPLLGFFFWDWSLYFILLFYFIDMITNEVFLHVKSLKRVGYSEKEVDKKHWFQHGILSFIVLAIVFLFIHVAMKSIVVGIDFKKEIIAFWNYTEMGIKQGYVLLPLIAFMGYQQYKMEFLLPAKYRKISTQQLWNNNIKAFLVIIAFTGLAFGITQFIMLPEIVFVLGIVVFQALYSWKFK